MITEDMAWMLCFPCHNVRKESVNIEEGDVSSHSTGLGLIAHKLHLLSGLQSYNWAVLTILNKIQLVTK